MNDYKIWDFWADKYEKLWVQKYSLTPTRKNIVKALSGILDKGRSYKILDIGCGTGQLLRDIQASFKELDIKYMGFDISSKMIEVAKSKSKTIDYFVGNVENFSSGGKTFDIITCSHSFPYYPNKPDVIDKFYKLLKEDGYLLMAQASVNNFYDWIIMKFVKLTTSKADYPGIKQLNQMLQTRFSDNRFIKMKEKFFMPSIFLSVSQKLSEFNNGEN